MAQNYDPNFDYQPSLEAAIAQARGESDDQAGGVSAQRRDLGDGDYEWRVTFDNDPARFMTVITDEDWSGLDDDEIAAQIESCWDSDWDDVLVENPVGDFSHGSSDFRGGCEPTDDESDI